MGFDDEIRTALGVIQCVDQKDFCKHRFDGIFIFTPFQKSTIQLVFILQIMNNESIHIKILRLTHIEQQRVTIFLKKPHKRWFFIRGVYDFTINIIKIIIMSDDT